VPTSRAGRRATQRSWIATGRASPTCETGDGVASGALTPNTAGRWGLLESFAPGTVGVHAAWAGPVAHALSGNFILRTSRGVTVREPSARR
jgi:hypothetical protein